MTTKLSNAIEGMYEAFADVPRPTTIDGCPCCVDGKDISVLLSKPLRELSPGELSAYASAVFLTVGAVEDFLYFLPRILEILALEAGWWPDPEIVGRAIITSAFTTWPARRQQAILHYFHETIAACLTDDDAPSDRDSWICTIGRAGVDLAPFLERVSADGSRLIEYYENNSKSLVKGRLANAFWDDCPEPEKQVVDWFQSAAIQGLIQREYGLG